MFYFSYPSADGGRVNNGTVYVNMLSVFGLILYLFCLGNNATVYVEMLSAFGLVLYSFGLGSLRNRAVERTAGQFILNTLLVSSLHFGGFLQFNSFPLWRGFRFGMVSLLAVYQRIVFFFNLRRGPLHLHTLFVCLGCIC